MDINRIYIWICFFLCIALSGGGVLIFFHKKEIRRIPASRFLQYSLIFIYTFGFYSLWSNVFFRLFVASAESSASLSAVPQYLALIGTPFLLTGMIMMMLWAVKLTNKRPEKIFLSVVLPLFFLIILLYLTYKRFDLLINIQQVYALAILLAAIFTGALLTFSRIHYIDSRSKMILVFLVFLSGLLHIPLFLRRINNIESELLFIFFFFLVNTAIGIFFSYNANEIPENEPDISGLFDGFIRQYGITSRESEVVQEIYKGKTNQEIADKLFVTVQTIKDHTHRIYLKTHVKNRAQLMSFLRKYEQQ